jgi:hypothetical protein
VVVLVLDGAARGITGDFETTSDIEVLAAGIDASLDELVDRVRRAG